MSSANPVLRGGTPPAAPYPLGAIPDSVIYSVSKDIVYAFASGRKDITGDDWADMFSQAIGAEHRQSPLGVTDVTLPGAAWSAKTVQASDVSRVRTVRLISGRNAVDLSYQNTNPRGNPQLAGGQVLRIWNTRVEQARREFANLRTVVLVRDVPRFRFKIFELEPGLYDPAAYSWTVNKKGNLEGRLRNDPPTHVFTWQPAGSQFTILAGVPLSGRSFDLRKPPLFDVESQMQSIGYRDSWVALKGPEVLGLGVVSAPQDDNNYRYSEDVRLVVTFNAAVVVFGAPVLRVRIGNLARDAIYHMGSGTEELVFRLFVGQGDRAPAGIRVEPDSLMLNGGRITGSDAGLPAVLSHPRLPANRIHRVNGGRR